MYSVIIIITFFKFTLNALYIYIILIFISEGGAATMTPKKIIELFKFLV